MVRLGLVVGLADRGRPNGWYGGADPWFVYWGLLVHVLVTTHRLDGDALVGILFLRREGLAKVRDTEVSPVLPALDCQLMHA